MNLYDYQRDMITGVHNAWRNGYKRPCIVLPCGGGKSIICADMAKRATDNRHNVLFLVHRQELCEQIQETFTSYGVDMTRCEVSMIQTAVRHTDTLITPTLIITDENHHCVASSYRKVYDSFPNSYCVGVTATPVRLNGGGLGKINDKLIVGPSVRELIIKNKLSPYDYFAPAVADLSGLKTRHGDYAAEDVAQALNKPKIYGDVVSYYRRLANNMKAICYCATITHSKQIAETFRSNGISAYHLDAKTPKNEREGMIRRFRAGDIQILCNVDLISEGFDVPDCNVSILLRPTKSLSLYIQQSMRCMRYQAGKRAVIIDHVGNVHRHGLPDTDRTWTLDPKPAPKKKNTVSVKQCPNCYFIHEPAPTCPKCGHVYVATAQELKEHREASLVQIVSAYQSPNQCRNVKELYAYAKVKKYKPGWAWYQATSRGWL